MELDKIYNMDCLDIFVITENGEFPDSKGVRLEYTAA